MVGRMARRLAVGGVLAVVGVMTVLGPSAAHAEGPDLITIAGDTLPEPIEVHVEDQPELFKVLHDEVNWLAGRPSQGGKPEDEETLGPKYEVIVHIDGKPRHRYNLYPLADGGPRAHRPEKQPGDRRTDSGWFYGRLSMPESLAAAGVPVFGETDTGGTGGGAAAPEETSRQRSAIAGVVEEWWAGMRVAGLVTGVIVLGVAVAAFAIRRAV